MMLQIVLTLTFVLAVITTFNNCGSSIVSRDSRYNSSSDYDYGECRNSNVSQNYTPVPCSGFDEGFITGSLSNFVDPYTYQLKPEVVRLKLNNIPSEVLNGTQKLVFYTWHETCDLARSYSPQPKNFSFQFVRNGAGSFYPNDENLENGTLDYRNADNSFTALTKNTIEKVTGHFLSQPDEFEEHFYIVFTDLESDDQAMMLGMFPNSGGSANSRVEFLLPPYWADPNVYDKTHTHSEIKRLHPMSDKKSSQSSYNGFYSEMMKYCADMQTD